MKKHIFVISIIILSIISCSKDRKPVEVRSSFQFVIKPIYDTIKKGEDMYPMILGIYGDDSFKTGIPSDDSYNSYYQIGDTLVFYPSIGYLSIDQLPLRFEKVYGQYDSFKSEDGKSKKFVIYSDSILFEIYVDFEAVPSNLLTIQEGEIVNMYLDKQVYFGRKKFISH